MRQPRASSQSERQRQPRARPRSWRRALHIEELETCWLLAATDLEVPYVHQVYDTPDDFDGTAACAPTSAVMTWAYYDRIMPWPTAVNTGGYHQSDYGRYVSEEYAYRFDGELKGTIAHEDPSGHDAEGAWGYIWQNDASGTGAGVFDNLQGYLEDHDLAVDWHASPSAEDAETLVRTEIDAGHPLIARTYLTGAGHYVVIVGYESDCFAHLLKSVRSVLTRQ